MGWTRLVVSVSRWLGTGRRLEMKRAYGGSTSFDVHGGSTPDGYVESYPGLRVCG